MKETRKMAGCSGPGIPLQFLRVHWFQKMRSPPNKMSCRVKWFLPFPAARAPNRKVESIVQKIEKKAIKAYPAENVVHKKSNNRLRCAKANVLTSNRMCLGPCLSHLVVSVAFGVGVVGISWRCTHVTSGVILLRRGCGDWWARGRSGS